MLTLIKVDSFLAEQIQGKRRQHFEVQQIVFQPETSSEISIKPRWENSALQSAMSYSCHFREPGGLSQFSECRWCSWVTSFEQKYPVGWDF